VFDEESIALELSLERLFEKAQTAGAQSFGVQLTATDNNATPRSTVYLFTILVPSLSEKDIGAFYASLINERVNSDTGLDLEVLKIPQLKSLEVTRTGEAYLCFSAAMLAKEPAEIKEDSLTLTLVPGSEETPISKHFSWKASQFTSECLKFVLTFDEPMSISSEGDDNMDQLEVRVRNPFLFRAKESL
jgi:hypothetical protein